MTMAEEVKVLISVCQIANVDIVATLEAVIRGGGVGGGDDDIWRLCRKYFQQLLRTYSFLMLQSYIANIYTKYFFVNTTTLVSSFQMGLTKKVLI